MATVASTIDATQLDARTGKAATSTTSRPTETIPATLVLTALSIITAIGFCRVFAGWEFLGPMVFVVIGVHFVCLAMRLLNTPGYVAIPAGLLVLFALIAWKYYPDTLSGPLPTSETWRLISADLRLAREQFPSATAPVAAVGGFVVAGTTAAGVAALLSDAFAFRAYGRAEAAVPTAVLFVFASALGVDNHRVVLTAVWLAAALAVIAVLRLTHSQSENTWIGRPGRVLFSVVPLAAALAGTAALSGALIGPALPGAGEKGLVDTHDKDNVTQVISPLVDLRSKLVNLSEVELFTVEASEPHYWRVSGLTEFDGTSWDIPNGSPAGNFPRSTPQAGARTLNQQVKITGLGGKYLPAAYSPRSVVGGNIFYVPSTATVIEPGDVRRNSNYQIVSTVLDLTATQLRLATSVEPPDPIVLDLPSDFPSSARQTAMEVTAAGATVYDKAILLEDWFRTNFVYDLNIQRGHSDDALENFLRVRRGYCEQFSAAFAAMARSVGIPARVAVGFTYGDLLDDGKYHVYGRNAHAWPEVWFDKIGWVSFEPTPGRGEPGTQAYTGNDPAQANPGAGTEGEPTETVPSPVESTTTVPGNSVVTTTTIAEPKPGAATPIGVEPPTSSGESGMTTSTKVIFLVLIGVGLWALLLPRVMRKIVWRHPPSSPIEQIERSWASAARALGVLNLAPEMGETPLEHAHRAERMTGLDRRTLRELALCATAAKYGHVGDKQTAARCALLASTIVSGVKQRLNGSERFAARFNPRRAGQLIPR